MIPYGPYAMCQIYNPFHTSHPARVTHMIWAILNDSLNIIHIIWYVPYDMNNLKFSGSQLQVVHYWLIA